MPVLMVSEKTWLQVGFSRKRSMRPSSSVTTIPNSSGFSTDFSPTVTAACFSRWKRIRSVRSTSQSASPEMTRNVSSSRPLASRTEPALLEELEDVLDARLADDRHHRLRLVRGEGAQARALPAGHDDRLHVRT